MSDTAHKSTIIGKKPKKPSKNQLTAAPSALIDTVLEVPEHVEGIREFRLVLNTATLRQSEKIANALITSRRLPFNPDAITISDPLALYIMSIRPDLPGQEAVREAESHYDLYIRQAQLDAMIVAITAYNELPNKDAKPYDESEEKLNAEWGEDGAPDWVTAIPKIPEPVRNLSNPYEKRLKIVMDFLELCGILFTAKFNAEISNNLAVKLREMGVEEQDEAGFPAQRDTQPVPSGDGSEGVH